MWRPRNRPGRKRPEYRFPPSKDLIKKMANNHIQPQRLEKLFRRLVDIYSPSGKEGDLLDYLKGYLKRRNLPMTVQAVDEDRYNIILAPVNKDIQLAFIGHIDTVTAPDLDNF